MGFFFSCLAFTWSRLNLWLTRVRVNNKNRLNLRCVIYSYAGLGSDSVSLHDSNYFIYFYYYIILYFIIFIWHIDTNSQGSYLFYVDFYGFGCIFLPFVFCELKQIKQIKQCHDCWTCSNKAKRVRGLHETSRLECTFWEQVDLSLRFILTKRPIVCR